MLSNRVFRTLLNKPAEIHAVAGGVAAARDDHARRQRVLDLAFGAAEPRSPLEADIHEQGWYAIGGLLAGALSEHLDKCHV